MAIDVPTFLTAFPEFRDAPTTLLAQKLTYAAQLVSATQWGQLQEQGVFLTLARSLALSPYGRKIGLVSKQGTSVYDEELRRLTLMVTAGARVL